MTDAKEFFKDFTPEHFSLLDEVRKSGRSPIFEISAIRYGIREIEAIKDKCAKARKRLSIERSNNIESNFQWGDL